MADGYSVVTPDDVEQDAFPESGIAHRKLTESLDCEEMRVNTCTLEPGQALGYHRHERQEEVYVLLQGAGHVKLAGDVVAVPEHGVVRVSAETPRKLLNRSDSTATWLMLGAPPVGTVEDFGEYVVVEEDR